MHHVFLHHLTKRSHFCRPFSAPSPLFIPRCGTANRHLFISMGLFFLLSAIGFAWYSRAPDELPNPEQSNLRSLCSPDKLATGEHSATRTINPHGSPPAAEEAGDLWRKIQQSLRVERVHHSGDKKWKERSIARKDYRKVRNALRDLRAQGLEGDALYAAAEQQLHAAHGPGVLKILDGYRQLEEELASDDLNSMSPEERLEYIHNARQYAFGEDTAHMLFFKDEARDRYNLQERALHEAPDLSEDTKQEQISLLRKKLRVDLASQGTSIRFADERLQTMEERLRDRHGKSVETMTPEERDQAVWDMYSEELPPDIMEKVRQIKTSWGSRTY